MTFNFLKKKTVTIEGTDLEIHQISGLDRFDYIEFSLKQERPSLLDKESVQKLSDEELKDYQDSLREWDLFIFRCKARLVAYGTMAPSENIEQKHIDVMTGLTTAHIDYLHNEIAELSGMVEPAKKKASDQDAEPVDPKQ
jgi:hypothetical protein